MKINISYSDHYNGVQPQLECILTTDVINAMGLVKIPRVFLSRNGKKCPTLVTQLQDHNDHAPVFPNQYEASVYVHHARKRITSAITNAIKKWHLTLQPHNHKGSDELLDVSTGDTPKQGELLTGPAKFGFNDPLTVVKDFSLVCLVCGYNYGEHNLWRCPPPASNIKVDKLK